MPKRIAVDPKGCTGCKTCELVCSLSHRGECNPDKAAIRVVRREKDGLVIAVPLVCQQCALAPCLEVCPSEALSRARGTLVVDREACTGCGLCTRACPAGCIFVESGADKAVVCDLCEGQPRCIDFCHAHCLSLAEDAGPGVERLAAVLAGDNPFSMPLVEGGL